MKTPMLKLLMIVSCLAGPLQAHAQEEFPDPFKDGITTIHSTESEKAELRHYLNPEKGKLQMGIDLAESSCGGKTYLNYQLDEGSWKNLEYEESDGPGRIDCKIKIYLDAIKAVVPESLGTLSDLQNFTATLLRISLNQGVFLEEKMHQASKWWTHTFRKADMLFAMQTAIELYKTDVELFHSKTTLEMEYSKYAVKFATFVDHHSDELSKHVAVEYYYYASQFLLNVLKAKGNTLQNVFGEEILNLEDIVTKTTPGYVGLFKKKSQQLSYARDEFHAVYVSLRGKFETYQRRVYDEAAAKKRKEEEQALSLAMHDAGSLEEAYFVGIARYPHSILIESIDPHPKRFPGEFDEIDFTYVSANNKDEPKVGRLICAVKLMESGIYLGSERHPFVKIDDAECFTIYQSTKDDNANGGTLSWPFPDQMYVVPSADGKSVFEPFTRDR